MPHADLEIRGGGGGGVGAVEVVSKQNHCRNHKAALNENVPTLRNDSSFAVQLLVSISVSKTRAILLFTI